MNDIYEDEQRPEPDWVYFTDPNRVLGKYCLAVAGLAILGWVLTDILNS